MFASAMIATLLATLTIAGCGESGDSKTIPQGTSQPTDGSPLMVDTGLAGDPWPMVLERGSGTLTAVYVPAAGFAYYDDGGRLTGVTVELLHSFADFVSARHNVDLTLEFISEENWRTFYNGIVDAGDGVIGMGNVTITEERRQELTFSPPYMTNIASLITHRDAPELTRLQDLEQVLGGRTALAFKGTLHEERLRALTARYYPGAQFRMAASNDEIIELVSSGDRYFAYIDLYNYWRAADSGLPLQRHDAADEAAEQFGYIMPRGTTWEPVITEFFEDGDGLTTSSRYHAIMEKHLGTRLAEILLEADSAHDE
jgi:ABC-type amino acid transport substrate-binding protein